MARSAAPGWALSPSSRSCRQGPEQDCISSLSNYAPPVQNYAPQFSCLRREKYYIFSRESMNSAIFSTCLLPFLAFPSSLSCPRPLTCLLPLPADSWARFARLLPSLYLLSPLLPPPPPPIKLMQPWTPHVGLVPSPVSTLGALRPEWALRVSRYRCHVRSDVLQPPNWNGGRGRPRTSVKELSEPVRLSCVRPEARFQGFLALGGIYRFV